MIIFTNKLPRTWRSSGVSLINGKLEMSSFSFLDESISCPYNSFVINIIGKNIIGNGLFSVEVLSDNVVILSDEFRFENVYFSKKQILVTLDKSISIKVIISRGKKSRGKIIIDRVSIHDNSSKVINEAPVVIKEAAALETEPSVIVPSYEPEIEVAPPISQKKKTGKKRGRLLFSNVAKITAETSSEIIIVADILNQKNKTIEEVPEDIPDVKKIAVTIIDLNVINDERDIFNFKNQISFGKDQQFLVVQSSTNPVNFSKYTHVKLFDDEAYLIEELKTLNISKLFFNKGNLKNLLLDQAEKVKKECSN